MARNSYQYETSPRKIQPDYKPSYRPDRTIERKTSKRGLSREEREAKERAKFEQEKNRKLELKHEKRKMYKRAAMIVALFLVLLAISYRNSLITQKFNELQDKKSELAAIQKTNEQLEVSIESSLNLSNVEELAENNIGMQKLSNDQKVYVTLPKKDYTESTSKEVTEETSSNWFESLFNWIFK